MKHVFLWTLTITVFIVTSSRAVRARAHSNESRSALTLVVKQVSELVRLRSNAKDALPPLRPEGGLAGKVSKALTRSGLASSILQGLSPENETFDKGLVRQRATLTLAGLSLPQVGKFLEAWRTDEPDWVISGLDLSPAGSGTPGADLPLRAVVTIDAVFKDRPRMPTEMHSGAPR